MADGDKQYVPLPDGSYLELPGDMKDEEINGILKKNAGQFGLPKAPPEVPPVPGAKFMHDLFRGDGMQSRIPVPGATTAGRIAEAVKGKVGEAWQRAKTPEPPGQEKSFLRRMGEAAGFGEGALFGGTGEAGGIAGGGYRPEDVAAPFVLGAGEAALPVIGRAAEKYMPATTGLARRAGTAISRFGRGAEAEAPSPGARPLPDTLPRATPPIGSSEAELDAATRRAGLGEKFGDLSHEDQMRVMRTYGGEAEPPIERRRPGGLGPPTAERRAAPTPVPRVTMAQTEVRPLPPGASARDVQFHRLFGPEYQEAGDLAEWETGSREGKPRPPLSGERLRDVAGIVEGAFNEPTAAQPAPYTMGEAMGVRVAKAPGLADVYIPNRMSEAEIPGFVAQQHALERQMKPGLPGQAPSTLPSTSAAKPSPAPRPAQPAPSGEAMPTTRPPTPPAPTTLGGGATMGQLPTEQQLAEEARRAGQMPKVTPPKEVP